MLTIVTPNANRDLTDLANLKAEIGTDSGFDDTQLGKFITQASNIIAQYCNRVFAIETVAETFRFGTFGAHNLMLSRYPITEVVSIIEVETTLTGPDYGLDPETGILDRFDSSDRVSCWQSGKTVITYKAGYTLPTGLPAGIEHACILLVKQFVASGDRDPMVRAEGNDGVGTTEFFSGGGTGLPPEVEGLISAHRKPNS